MMDMIEAMARAILPGIDEAADFVKECAFITAQAAITALRPHIEAEKAEAVRLAVEAEREACAGVADQEALACDEGDEDAYWIAAASIARAIRARGEG